MSNVNDHNVGEHVDISEVPLELVQVGPRLFELGSRPHCPVVHHHADGLELPVKLGFHLSALSLQTFKLPHRLIESFTVTELVAAEFVQNLQGVVLGLEIHVSESVAGLHLRFLDEIDRRIAL